MALQTTTRPRMGAPPSGAAPMFGVFLILWVAFAAALIFNHGALDTVWHWLLGLPLILKVILWVLFLPVMVGLWIWESDWALWLRLLLVIVIAVGNLAAFSPKPPRSSRKADLEP